jgi:hypothetical protein
MWLQNGASHRSKIPSSCYIVTEVYMFSQFEIYALDGEKSMVDEDGTLVK